MLLPLELVFQIIESLRPKYSNVLLRHSHPITQTLLSFTLVCRATRPVANRCLLQHCVYLSSKSRLQSFLSDLSNRPELGNTKAIFLNPYSDVTDNLYNDTISVSIHQIFSHTYTSLRRLIIDWPAQESEDLFPHQLPCVLGGLMLLENLEEFVSVQVLFGGTFFAFRPYGSNENSQICTKWPKLRRLALFGRITDGGTWTQIAQQPQLETFVLTCATGLETCNIKALYFSKTQRPIKIMLVNKSQKQIRFSQFAGRRDWDRNDPDKKMTIMTYDVPDVFEEDSAGNDKTCQEYVRAGAENGTLWQWEGEVISHPPVFPLRSPVAS